MKKRFLHVFLALAFVGPAVSRAGDDHPGARPPEPKAPEKELSREDISKLGGFEPAPADPDAKGVPNVNFDVLMISLPEDLAMPLVDTFRDPAKAESACQKVMELIATKKAKVSAWPRVEAKIGNRSVMENIQEVRYPIEFEQDQPGAPAAPGAVAAPAAGPAKAPPVPAQPLPGPPVPAALNMIPTTFETRNIGATLEAEPNLWPDGETIAVDLTVLNVRLLGWDNIREEQNGQTKSSIPQPRFQTNKISQIITIRSGERRLIGTYRLPGEENQMELFILGASISYPAMKGKEKAR